MAKDSLHLPEDLLYRIKQMSKWRDGTEGRRNHSSNDIIDDLMEFVDTDLKKKLIGQDTKASIDAAVYEQNKKLYARLKTFKIKRTSFQNLFNGIGVSKINYSDIEIIFKYYLEGYENLVPVAKSNEGGEKSIVDAVMAKSQFIEHRSEHVLPIEVIKTIILQSATLCNFPDCYRPITAQSEKARDTITSIGKVCMIYGDQPGMPRYDPVVSIDFYSPANCILMCANHALTINEADGNNYQASELFMWKNKMTDSVRKLNEGKAKIQITGLYFNSQRKSIAENLFRYFNDLHFLHLKMSADTIPDITAGCRELRSLLLSDLNDTAFPDYLTQQLSGALYLSDTFIDALQSEPDLSNLSISFSVFKKIFGSLLLEISKKYKLQLPLSLSLLSDITEDSSNESDSPLR